MRETTTKEYTLQGAPLTIQTELGGGSVVLNAKLAGMPYAPLLTMSADEFKILDLPPCTLQVVPSGGAAFAVNVRTLLS